MKHLRREFLISFDTTDGVSPEELAKLPLEELIRLRPEALTIHTDSDAFDVDAMERAIREEEARHAERMRWTLGDDLDETEEGDLEEETEEEEI